jgi:general secretion pathway protein H
LTSKFANGERGFTLLELMAVLLIIGLATAITLPSFERGLRKRQVRQSVLGLAATARDLRRRAIDDGTLKLLTLSPREDSYLASGGEIVHLPEALKITGVAGGEPIGDQLTQFVFFPNGSILGGAIELSDREGPGYLIRLEPMVGRVVVVRQ